MSDETTYIPLTELDRQSFQGTSQMLKAAVTYMDPSSGKMLAMLARMLELKQTINLFNQEQISICSVPTDGHRPESRKFSRISANTALPRRLNRSTSFSTF